jgi:hypothetical protein
LFSFRAVARHPQLIFSAGKLVRGERRAELKLSNPPNCCKARQRVSHAMLAAIVVAHGDSFDLFAPLRVIRHDLLIFGLLHSRRRGWSHTNSPTETGGMRKC